jgi:hypothetical protein
MSKSRHTKAEMIAALKQAEAGRKVDDVAREAADAEPIFLRPVLTE